MMLSDKGPVRFMYYEFSACTADCERSTRTSEACTGKYQPIHGNQYSYLDSDSCQCACGISNCIDRITEKDLVALCRGKYEEPVPRECSE